MIRPARDIAYGIDPVLWAVDVLGIPPRKWQEEFLRVARGQDVLVLTARQIGKSTVAAIAMAHTAVFRPGSLSVVACPAQRQAAEPLRKVRDMLLKTGQKLVSDNVYGLELANGSRVLALPGSEESIRGLTVDGWIVVDEAAHFQDDRIIAALRPMRAQKPEARFVMLSTANTRTDHFYSQWETGGENWLRISVTIDDDPTLYDSAYLDNERRVLGEDRFKREFRGIPAGGPVSPFGWDLFDRAIQKLLEADAWRLLKPTIIVHDVGHTKDRSTAVVGGKTILAPGLSLLERFEELPQGLYASSRAEALVRIDQLYGSKNLIFVDVSFDPTYAELLAERFGTKRVIGIKIGNAGDGSTAEGWPTKYGTICVYHVSRTHLFDLLHRELHEHNVRILDGPASRRAYQQLTLLEMEYRQTGTIYHCPSGRHDDLAISTAIAVWALHHPHLGVWMRALEPRPNWARKAGPSPLGWT
jgi:hypothetical protein